MHLRGGDGTSGSRGKLLEALQLVCLVTVYGHQLSIQHHLLATTCTPSSLETQTVTTCMHERASTMPALFRGAIGYLTLNGS